MACKKLTSLALAVVFGTASIGSAQARSNGKHASEGVEVAHIRGASGLRNASVPPPAWVGQWEFANRALYPHRTLVTPYDRVGVFWEPFLTCWTWIPSNLGWQRVWECKDLFH